MREKQIEEMAKMMVDSNNKEVADALSLFFVRLAEALYNAGYRKQEWISVEERLPKRWEMVLVFCDDTISTDFISSMGRWFEHIDHDSVTHWMPLPEAPKMKGGAE